MRRNQEWRKEVRRELAEQRQEDHNRLTTRQKLTKLERRGHAYCSEALKYKKELTS